MRGVWRERMERKERGKRCRGGKTKRGWRELGRVSLFAGMENGIPVIRDAQLGIKIKWRIVGVLLWESVQWERRWRGRQRDRGEVQCLTLCTKIPGGLRFTTMSPMASRQSLLPILILLSSSGEVE